jgi:hypothetical protein
MYMPSRVEKIIFQQSPKKTLLSERRERTKHLLRDTQEYELRMIFF